MPGADVQTCRNNVDTASRLFAEHGSFIRAVIRSKVKGEAQAADIFQDFFLDLVRKPVPKYVRNIKSYLYRAIANDAVDYIRRRERYEALIGRCSEQYSNSINETSVEDALITEEEISQVLGIIERHLDSCESRAITLRHGSSMNIKEVAEKMRIKSRSVSRYISVGLKKLRQLLTVERGG